jgi:hypothetical protein
MLLVALVANTRWFFGSLRVNQMTSPGIFKTNIRTQQESISKHFQQEHIKKKIIKKKKPAARTQQKPRGERERERESLLHLLFIRKF